jgi:MFS family permease
VNDFNKLWAGQTVSLLGSALTMFALPTLAVLVLHATPVQVGALSALQTLPFPILGMAVGVIADRVSRRKIMVVADAVRFFALATIPCTAIFHALSMPQLYAVSLVTGCASAFFGITYQSYLPVIVPPNRLTDANTKLEFSNSGTAMTGNALAGALVQWIGAPAAIAFDAFTYVVSVLSLLGIRRTEQPHEWPEFTLRQAFREMREGIDVVVKSPGLCWISCATATVNFGGSMISAVFLIYAYRLLHLQPGLLGLADGLGEIGFLGALLSTRVRNRLGLRSTLVLGLAAGGIGTATMLLAQAGQPYVVLFFSTAIVAISIPIYNVNQISYRQALVNVRLQGRMNATIRTVVWGTLPLGALAGGFLATAIGVPDTIASGAALTVLSSVWLFPLRERPLVLESPAAAAVE